MENKEVNPKDYKEGIRDNSFACDYRTLDLNRAEGSHHNISLKLTNDIKFIQNGEIRNRSR